MAAGIVPPAFCFRHQPLQWGHPRLRAFAPQSRVRSSGSSSLTPASFSSVSDDCPGSLSPGYSVIEEFYAGINRRDIDSVRDLIAEDCIYEDLIFAQPFVGRKAIIEFFSKFTGVVGPELQFSIDEISKNDPMCIGVTWHLEWQGRPFPFSKGCSFYRLTTTNGKQQIIYGRDIVELAIKPGDAALIAIKAVAGLLKRFPWLLDRI